MNGNVWFFAGGFDVAILVGLLPILLHLVLTKHARFEGEPPAYDEIPYGRVDRTVIIGCGDIRCNVNEVLFGGAAAFAPGYLYALFGYMVGGASTPGGSFLYGYAAARCSLVAAQMFRFILLLLKHRTWLRKGSDGYSNVVIKAHTSGCGYVTGSGLLFGLYWLQKLTHWRWIEKVRDVDTWMSMWASVPLHCVMGWITKLITRATFEPTVVDVDTIHT